MNLTRRLDGLSVAVGLCAVGLAVPRKILLRPSAATTVVIEVAQITSSP